MQLIGREEELRMVLQHPRKVRPPRALSVLFAVIALVAIPAAAASAHTLQPPGNLQATAGSGGVSLTWTASSDGHVAGYNVYRRTANGAFAGIAQTSGASYTDSGATGGTYHVTAYDSQGAESAPTNDATAGCGAGASSDPGPAASADVNVGDNYFRASTVEVKPGGTVTWHWTTGTTHTVSADAGQAETFDTSQSYGTYAHTFTQAGRYTYVCHRHSGMSGVVIVRDAPTTADSTAPPTPTAV